MTSEHVIRRYLPCRVVCRGGTSSQSVGRWRRPSSCCHLLNCCVSLADDPAAAAAAACVRDSPATCSAASRAPWPAGRPRRTAVAAVCRVRAPPQVRHRRAPVGRRRRRACTWAAGRRCRVTCPGERPRRRRGGCTSRRCPGSPPAGCRDCCRPTSPGTWSWGWPRRRQSPTCARWSWPAVQTCRRCRCWHRRRRRRVERAWVSARSSRCWRPSDGACGRIHRRDSRWLSARSSRTCSRDALTRAAPPTSRQWSRHRSAVNQTRIHALHARTCNNIPTAPSNVCRCDYK